MAAGTVAYTDTTGNKDYLGMIASQIGKRLNKLPIWRQRNVLLQNPKQKKINVSRRGGDW